jgi:ADP-heptose:LPS heptosyltransferase
VFFLMEQAHHIILVGDAADRQQTTEWKHERIFNLCGETSIGQSAFIMKHALLTVCNDSGPMHLSYSIGTPVIAIFSARGYKGKWFPPADGKNKVLGNFDVPCAVCLLGECGHHICMEGISVKKVLTCIDEALTPTHA